MSKRAQLKRKSFFIDEATLQEAKRALHVESDAEAVRLSLEQVAEMGRFWRFMDKSKGKLKPGSFGDVWVAYAIIDTNVYIDYWQGSISDRVLADRRKQYVVRQSAVVLSELWRGARGRKAQRLVNELRNLATIVWEPAEADWWTAGELIRTIGDAQEWEPGKRREFQNDALIALTAKRHGAVVITTNTDDFRLLATKIELQFVPAGS
jgi:predicted nucleic acid-binding protein